MLLADTGEVDHRFCFVTETGDVDDHAFAKRWVGDVIADSQPELLRVGWLGSVSGTR